MPKPASGLIKPDHSLLLVWSALIAFFGLLIMLLRIAQQNYMMAIGAVWAANGLTMVLHALYWRRYGLSKGCKVAVVIQGVLTIAPLWFGGGGLLLIFFMFGGELRFW
ncbi:hypothetical protein ACQKQA_02095 [Pseudomonas sp. NPDC089530]|uniref:hypothetical protein n=1 Tax=Pseudomonas sp. NPDC089530 TaxID=3390651 RepID=UPI003CFD20C4